MIYFSVGDDLGSFTLGICPLFDNYYQRRAPKLVSSNSKKGQKKAPLAPQVGETSSAKTNNTK